MKKNIKFSAILLLIATLLCSTILCGCAAEKNEYPDEAIRASVNTAAKERVKTEISNEHKDFEIAKAPDGKEDLLVVESITNDGYYWYANGNVTLKSVKNESKEQTVDFSISLELIDYAGQPSPTFKLIEFNLGEILAP